MFLPKYSPDLNPIEEVFAKFKTLLRKVGARNYEAISQASGEILAQYPPADAPHTSKTPNTRRPKSRTLARHRDAAFSSRSAGDRITERIKKIAIVTGAWLRWNEESKGTGLVQAAVAPANSETLRL